MIDFDPLKDLSDELTSRAMARDSKLAWDFDPGEPRKEDGEWTAGGGGGAKAATAKPKSEIFASPSINKKDFGGAEAATKSPRQAQMREAVHSVNELLGLQSTEHDAVGAWSDGAEPTVVADLGAVDWDKLTVAGAMMGSLANQKSVLVFQAGHGHKSDFLAEFDVKGKLADIHNDLLAKGLAFHTLEPTSDGAHVYVYSSHEYAQDTMKAVSEAAAAHGAQVNVTFGEGQFVGTQKGDDAGDAEQRADAQRVYADTIGSYAVPERGGSHVGEGWKRISDRWASLGSEAEGRTEGVKAAT